MQPLLQLEDIIIRIQHCNSASQALHLFTKICEHGFDTDAEFVNKFVPLLIGLDRMDYAQQVFNRVNNVSESSWNSLIIGYVKSGQPAIALSIYQKIVDICQPNLNNHAFVALLNSCASIGDLKTGCDLHTIVATQSCLKDNVFVGSSLIHMYAKCGCLRKAQEVLDNLTVRNVVSWTVLIAGYSDTGESEQALKCVEQMQLEGISPNPHTLVCCLKSCSNITAISKGMELHDDIIKKGWIDCNVILGSALVHMYGKCGHLAEAQNVFDSLSLRNEVSWNTVIIAYAEHGHGEEALAYFELMQDDDIYLSSVTYISGLKACIIVGAVTKGQKMHIEITKKGLDEDLIVNNALVDMYAKSSLLRDAEKIFSEIPVRDIISWTAVITGFLDDGQSESALCYFQSAIQEGIVINEVATTCGLKACASIGDLEKGQEIHVYLMKRGFEGECSIGNTLIDMYFKCHLLMDAENVFLKLPHCTVVSWNALIAGYSDAACYKEALESFQKMQSDSFSPDSITMISILKACDSSLISNVHDLVIKKGIEGDAAVGNALMDMYAKSGMLAEMESVFDMLPVHSLISWTVIINCFVEHEHVEKVVCCFEKTQEDGVYVNAFTYSCFLKACSSMGAHPMGLQIHQDVTKKGLEANLHIASALIDMYFTFGLQKAAQEVFDKALDRDIIMWNAVIDGYSEHGLSEEAITIFERMQSEGISFDNVSLISTLKACSAIRRKTKGQEVHNAVTKMGLENDLVVGNSLVDMYIKCGCIEDGRCTFDKLWVHDAVSWNALIGGYVEQGYSDEALYCFEQMHSEGISSNVVTCICCLKVCAANEAADKGQQLHSDAVKKGWEAEDLIGNILVDMYAVCGLLAQAEMVHHKLPSQVLSSWNALLTGYAQVGDTDSLFCVYTKMLEKGLMPDLVTLISILNACSHAGLVYEGHMYFKAIRDCYSLTPALEHYSCLIDLFGRAGCVENVAAVIEEMPFHPSIVVWHTMLGACRKWSNLELGKHAFENIVGINEHNTTAYISLFNIYAESEKDSCIE